MQRLVGHACYWSELMVDIILIDQLLHAYLIAFILNFGAHAHFDHVFLGNAFHLSN